MKANFDRMLKEDMKKLDKVNEAQFRKDFAYALAGTHVPGTDRVYGVDEAVSISMDIDAVHFITSGISPDDLAEMFSID